MTHARTDGNVFAERFGTLSPGEMAPVDDGLRATVPPGTLIDLLGIELTHVGPGAARATMKIGEQHLNQVGVAQAGAVVAMADAVAGWAAKTALADGAVFTTLELNVNLARAAKPGDVLVATATPVHLGRSTYVLSVDVRKQAVDGEPGALVAAFRCTEMVITK